MNYFGPRPKPPRSSCLNSSHTIIVTAYDAASSFLELFDDTRHNRNAQGTPTNNEQDLLRAMLVFACAGLDSMTKQLVRDTIGPVIEHSDGAHVQFQSFVERRLLRQGTIDPKFLSNVLTQTNPRNILIAELVNELTSRSLQSKEQILRTAAYFDIPSNNVTANISKLEEIFECRNQISHEMDVDLVQPNRNRRPRRKATMIEHTKIILQMANKLLQEVDKKLP